METFYRVDARNQYHHPSGSDTASPLFGYTEETVAQHKYARLSMAAYHHHDQTTVSEIFGHMDELCTGCGCGCGGYVLDPELSTAEASVFHSKRSGETVIAYRGTATLADIRTDGFVLHGRENTTDRYRAAERTYDATVEKYGRGNLTLTGHSLGGGLALHVAELHDLPSYTFNPAVSPRQVAQSHLRTHRRNTHTQVVYRTVLDPVSIGAELTGNDPKRQLVRVANHESAHAHALDRNFYHDDAQRRSKDGPLLARKETLAETVDRHRTYASYAQRMYDAYEKAKDIDGSLDDVNSDADVLTRLPKAVYRAIRGARRGDDPRTFQNQTSRSLNPYVGFVPDPDYQWEDKDVITPLYRAGQLLRTRERRQTDKLLSLAQPASSIRVASKDATGFTTASGVRYNEVP